MMFDKILTPDVPRERVVKAVHLVLRAISHRRNEYSLMANLEDETQENELTSLVKQLVSEIERKADTKFNRIPGKKLEYYANKMAKVMTQRVRVETDGDRKAVELGLDQLRSSFDV